MGAQLGALTMADQALFAYRVELPDGSQAIRTGGADQPPTHGQLADYAANQGERYLGPVEMSPAIPTGSQAQAAPAPPPAQAVATPSAAPIPDRSLWTQTKETLVPERTFTSQLPSIGGSMLAGGAVSAVPGAWPLAPLAAGAGSAMGELGQMGIEYLTGSPPAEEGDVWQRTQRAYIRGAAGEAIAQPIRLGAQAVVRAIRPAAQAAAEVAPVLTREVPAAATVARVPVDELLQDPAQMATRLSGWNPSPEARNLLLGRWWQTNASQGGQALGEAWDALGEAGQRALAGEQHGAMTTLVDTARQGLPPLSSITLGGIARQGAPGTAAYYLGFPKTAAAISLAQQVPTAVEKGVLPYAARSPTFLPWLAALPKAAPLATPAEWALRFGTQTAAQRNPLALSLP